MGLATVLVRLSVWRDDSGVQCLKYRLWVPGFGCSRLQSFCSAAGLKMITWSDFSSLNNSNPRLTNQQINHRTGFYFRRGLNRHDRPPCLKVYSHLFHWLPDYTTQWHIASNLVWNGLLFYYSLVIYSIPKNHHHIIDFNGTGSTNSIKLALVSIIIMLIIIKLNLVPLSLILVNV